MLAGSTGNRRTRALKSVLNLEFPRQVMNCPIEDFNARLNQFSTNMTHYSRIALKTYEKQVLKCLLNVISFQ